MRVNQVVYKADVAQLGVANLALGGRAGFKVGTRKGVLSLIDESVKKTPKDTTKLRDD